MLDNGDSRLFGRPGGTILREHAHNKWQLVFAVYVNKKQTRLYYQAFKDADFGRDRHLSLIAAQDDQRLQSDLLGKTRNICQAVVPGEILMDVGRGLTMKFSASRLDELIPYKWYTQHSGGKVYVIARIGGKTVSCQRFLRGLKDADEHVVDHINGDTLDNRDSNLRVVTQAVNSQNQRLRKDSKSGVSGVAKSIIKGVPYYRAYWRANGKSYQHHFRIGAFESEEQAFAKAVALRQAATRRYDIQTRERSLGLLDESDPIEPELEAILDKAARGYTDTVALYTKNGTLVGYRIAIRIGHARHHKCFNFANYPSEEATREAALTYRADYMRLHRPAKRKRDDAEQSDDADEKPDLPQSKKQRVHEPVEKQA